MQTPYLTSYITEQAMRQLSGQEDRPAALGFGNRDCCSQGRTTYRSRSTSLHDQSTLGQTSDLQAHQHVP